MGAVDGVHVGAMVGVAAGAVGVKHTDALVEVRIAGAARVEHAGAMVGAMISAFCSGRVGVVCGLLLWLHRLNDLSMTDVPVMHSNTMWEPLMAGMLGRVVKVIKGVTDDSECWCSVAGVPVLGLRSVSASPVAAETALAHAGDHISPISDGCSQILRPRLLSAIFDLFSASSFEWTP